MLVTPARIRATYTCLLSYPPFNRWKLPPADRLIFELTNDPSDDAEFYVDSRDRMHIVLNPSKHVTLYAVTATVAHEMIHLRQHLLGRLPDAGHEHNVEFYKIAATVCRQLGFDAQAF